MFLYFYFYYICDMEFLNKIKYRENLLGRHIKRVIIANTNTDYLDNLCLSDFENIGCHYFIKLNGDIQYGLDLDEFANYKYGFNKTSIVIKYAGGLRNGKYDEGSIFNMQKFSLQILLDFLTKTFPDAEIVKGIDIKERKEKYENK